MVQQSTLIRSQVSKALASNKAGINSPLLNDGSGNTVWGATFDTPAIKYTPTIWIAGFNCLHISFDGGNTFYSRLTGLSNSFVNGGVYANGPLVVAGTDNAKVAISTNYGLTWTQSDFASPTNYGNTNLVFVANSYIYACFSNGYVARSSNLGVSWTTVLSGFTGSASAMAIEGDQVMYFASTANLFKSTNGGASWINIYSKIGNYLADVAVRGSEVWIADGRYLRVSYDRGMSFNTVYDFGQDAANIRFKGQNTIYICSYYLGLRRSYDNGATFTASPQSFSSQYTMALIGDRIYTGGDAGFIYTDDDGVTKTTVAGAPSGATNVFGQGGKSRNSDFFGFSPSWSFKHQRLRSAGTSLSSGTTVNVTADSLRLGPGVYDISANVGVNYTSATATQIAVGISTTSATLPPSDTLGSADGTGQISIQINPALTSTTTDIVTPIAPYRIFVKQATTFYLVGRSTFSAGSASIYGSFIVTQVP